MKEIKGTKDALDLVNLVETKGVIIHYVDGKDKIFLKSKREGEFGLLLSTPEERGKTGRIDKKTAVSVVYKNRDFVNRYLETVDLSSLSDKPLPTKRFKDEIITMLDAEELVSDIYNNNRAIKVAKGSEEYRVHRFINKNATVVDSRGQSSNRTELKISVYKNKSNDLISSEVYSNLDLTLWLYNNRIWVNDFLYNTDMIKNSVLSGEYTLDTFLKRKNPYILAYLILTKGFKPVISKGNLEITIFPSMSRSFMLQKLDKSFKSFDYESLNLPDFVDYVKNNESAVLQAIKVIRDDYVSAIGTPIDHSVIADLEVRHNPELFIKYMWDNRISFTVTESKVFTVVTPVPNDKPKFSMVVHDRQGNLVDNKVVDRSDLSAWLQGLKNNFVRIHNFKQVTAKEAESLARGESKSNLNTGSSDSVGNKEASRGLRLMFLNNFDTMIGVAGIRTSISLNGARIYTGDIISYDTGNGLSTGMVFIKSDKLSVTGDRRLLSQIPINAVSKKFSELGDTYRVGKDMIAFKDILQ